MGSIGNPRNRSAAEIPAGKVFLRDSLSECGYLLDLAEGTCKEWYPGGRLKRECGYIRGKKNGHCIWYYPDGKKASEAVYLSDSVVGESRSWHRDGTIESIVNDTLALQFFPNGKVDFLGRREV